MYVLVVVGWILGNGGGGPFVSMQEFTSLGTCQAAARLILDKLPYPSWRADNPVVKCIEK